jgi:hypothetical protein
MRTATCFTLIAIGAILTFAITAHPRVLNFQVAGVVIMAVGVAGLLLPGRGQDWLRRRIVLRRGSRGQVVGQVDETRYPSYVMLNPDALHSVQPEGPPEEAAEEEGPPFIVDLPAGQAAPSADTEIVEEYLEE